MFSLKDTKKQKIEIIVTKEKVWYSGQIKWTRILSQWETIEELIINIKDALKIYTDCQKSWKINSFEIWRKTNKFSLII